MFAQQEDKFVIFGGGGSAPGHATLVEMLNLVQAALRRIFATGAAQVRQHKFAQPMRLINASPQQPQIQIGIELDLIDPGGDMRPDRLAQTFGIGVRTAHHFPVGIRAIMQNATTDNARAEGWVKGVLRPLVENPSQIIAHIANGSDASSQKSRPHDGTVVDMGVDQTGQQRAAGQVNARQIGWRFTQRQDRFDNTAHSVNQHRLAGLRAIGLSIPQLIGK